MDKLVFEKNEELKSYEKILNGIIAVNIGAAIIPFEKLSSWEHFLADWARFQKENKKDITAMMRQFGKVEKIYEEAEDRRTK